MSEGSERKNPEIEILRGIAVLFVIAAHVPVFLKWHPTWMIPVISNFHFWSGVDLFFCISGFVIMNSVQDRFLSTDGVAYLKETIAFWIRRAFRLFPSAWFWLSVGLVLSFMPLPTGDFSNPTNQFKDILASVFYMYNFHINQCMTPGSGVLCGSNGQYWSLSLEEQFYILLPLLLFVLRERIWILAVAAILFQFPLDRPILSLSWLVRTDAIFWGILIAMASRTAAYAVCKPVFLRDWRAGTCYSLFLLVALAGFANYNALTFNTGMIAIVSALLVWVASYNDNLLFKRASSRRFMLWVGSRSYAIYLIHATAFSLVIDLCIRHAGPEHQLGQKYTLPILAGGTIFTFVLAELSYRLIEAPLRAYGRRAAAAFLTGSTVQPQKPVVDASEPVLDTLTTVPELT